MTVPEAEEARRTADDILSGAEYAEEVPSVVDRAIDWLFERFGDLFGTIVGTAGNFWVGYTILGVAVAVAAYLLWRFIPRSRLAPKEQVTAVSYETSDTPTRTDWLRRAGEAEQRGEWDAAVHARYHALTSGLAETDAVPSDPSTTSGEHRRAFASSGAEAPAVDGFGSATDRFEHVWFGGDDAGPDDNDTLRRVDEELLR